MEAQGAAPRDGDPGRGFSGEEMTGSEETGGGILTPPALSIPEGAVVVADMTAGAQRVVEEIRREYELAQTAKQSAIEHAVRCGRLLLAMRARLPYGEFGSWIETRCGIAYSTAARYMTAARRISTGVEISSLSSVFPSGRKANRSREALPAPQAPAAPPTDVPAAPGPNSDDLTLEQATAVIRRQNNFVRKYGRLLKSESDALKEVEKLRKELARAELIHRNAVTSIVGVAKKIEADAKDQKEGGE